MNGLKRIEWERKRQIKVLLGDSTPDERRRIEVARIEGRKLRKVVSQL